MEFKPYKSQSGTVMLQLDISDLDLPNKENLAPQLFFGMKSYDKITSMKAYNQEVQDVTHWEGSYAVINRMFQLFTVGMAKIYIECAIEIKRQINDYFVNGNSLTLEEMANNIGVVVDAMEQRMGLGDFVWNFIEQHVPFELTPDAGKHAQDSTEMTWYPEQAQKLMTLILLCKICSPFFGEISTALMNSPNQKQYRDIICAQILDRMLERKYSDITAKLKYYIKRIMSRQIVVDKSALMHNITLDSTCFEVYTHLLTRKYVNVDLSIHDSNPVTLTLVGIKRFATTKNQNNANKKTMERKPQTISTNDDDRIAQLEIDSMTSQKTADILPLTRFAAASIIKRVRAKFSTEFSDDDFAQSCAFYRDHPIVPNIINRNMNSLFYGPALGGSSGLLLLKAEEYTQLTCLLQLIMLTSDVNYQELAHMMTAVPAVGLAGAHPNTGMLKLRATTSPSYRNIRQWFENSPHGVKGKDWDRHVANIADEIASSQVVYNTAFHIWQFLEQDCLNGRTIEVTEKTIDGFCSMYEFIIEIRDHE